ncbi:MAG: carboxypeptidase regulatory-like domain-containing protein [Thermoplasmata archaeon YP2-bin.285]|uniref:Carboxypeptidase regulatory-like domain-containing protein n=1 Tax=Candidatus Sysuiplasma superficiale TaxID=2823368 RepID=A0A8J8CBT7_9ARCH|nr:carboxypeptidase regulatory-like domain-containing protein [Candidatus Sysuiplasma superficiale]
MNALKISGVVAALLLVGLFLIPAVSQPAAAATDYYIVARVVNVSGQPMQDVEVTISNVTGTITYSLKTDSQGTAMQQVPSGTYNITARFDGYYANRSYSSVNVDTGNFYANFTMIELQGNLTGFVSNGFISIPGATVTLENSSIAYTTHTSQPLGEYSFSGIPGGRYNVTVSDTGYLSNETTVRIVAGVQSWLNFTLQPLLGQIIGIVNSTTSAGRIIQLADANVTLSGPGVFMHTVTNSHGIYQFMSLKAGTYTVKVGKNGYSPGQATVVVQLSRIVYLNFTLVSLSHSYLLPLSGFIGKLDLNHSLMFVALALSIVIVSGSVTLLNKSYNWRERQDGKGSRQEERQSKENR